MERVKVALRLGSSLCLLALTACSGGGGGGSVNSGLNNPPANNSGNNGGTSNTGGNSTGNTTPPPTVSITAPDSADVSIGASGFNFTTNLPPSGTVFSLRGPAVKVTDTTVSAANKGLDGTATFRGLAGANIPLFDISIPALGLTASNVRADGTTTKLADGSEVFLILGRLNYTVEGAWGYRPGTGSSFYAGATVAGSGTPIANLPATGSATYSGTGASGGTDGSYFIPSGTGTIALGGLSGDVAISVNFATGGVTGTLSNMKASANGITTPWNNVSLSGNINRNNASFAGTATTGDAPAGAGPAGFSGSATGGFSGAFFGPNAQETGGTWTLTDPSAGGKTAFGAFGAATTGCTGCGNGGTVPPPPTSGIAGPASTSVSGFSGSALGTSFTTNPPTIGQSIKFGGGAVSLTSAAVGDAQISELTATYRGSVTSNGVAYPLFDLTIPALSLTASNVRGDGTPVTLPNGGQVSAAAATMNYTMLGAWSYIPTSGASYIGQVVTGYSTPAGSVPTSGSATYGGTGGVIGAYFVPSGTGTVQAGTLSGDVSLNVNFASNTTSGTLTNMQAKAVGSSTTTPWNSVSLTGHLNRETSSVSMSGTTSTTANAGPAGFSGAATGSFTGMLYGPTAQEVGAMWTLSESTGGGKAAFGTFGAKQ
jgi:hypothetical protein